MFETTGDEQRDADTFEELKPVVLDTMLDGRMRHDEEMLKSRVKLRERK